MTKRSRSTFDGSHDENILFCDEDILHDKENNSSLGSKFDRAQTSGNLVIDTANTVNKKNRFNSNTPISPIEPLPKPSPPLSTRKKFEATQSLQPEPFSKFQFSIVEKRETPTPVTPTDTKPSFQLYTQDLSPLNTPDTESSDSTTPQKIQLRRTNSKTCKTLIFEDNGNNTSTCSTSSTSSGSLSGESYICSSISPPTPDTPPSPKYQFLSPLSPLSPLHTVRGNSSISSPMPTQNASPLTKRALKGFVPCMSPYERSLRIQSLRLSHSLQIDDSHVRVPPPIQTQGLSKASVSTSSIGSGGASPTTITMSPVDLGEMSPGVFCDPTPFDTPGSEEFNLLLPTIQGAKVPDCNSITPETMTRVLSGEFNDRADVIIVDCRFPFEYEGGHIRGAVNIFEPESLERLVFDEKRLESLSQRETMIIFHCEFSQHRAPKLYRHLRELDRKYHHDTYPNLYYTNIYLMEGGYRGFYTTSEESKHQCEPKAYVEMNDKSFAQQCKQSWAEMRKCWQKKKRAKSQLSMSYLARQR